MSEPGPRKGLRWWPAAAILLLCAAGLVANGLRDVPHRQGQTFVAFQILFLGLLALAVWLLFFSRLPWIRRCLSLGIAALLLTSFAALFRIEGVSGDFIPILAWRWASGVPGLPSGAAGTVEENSAWYPQFLGPGRNARLRGIHLDPDWQRRPPRELWRREVGDGWSAFAVAQGRAVTQEQRGALETVVCYDLLTGEVVWAHADSTRYESTLAGIGPRATPTIAGDRVYTMGATGILNSLDLETGRLRWSRDIIADNEGQAPIWGISASPLVLDSLVVVSPGGDEGRSLAAYHADRGDVVWTGGRARAGYSSPSLAQLAGRRQILVFARKTVVSHSPLDGEVLWRQPWPGGTECVAQPVPLPGDQVLVSSGYGIGSRLYKVTAGPGGDLSASVKWESPRLKAKFTNVVFHDGSVYGLDDGVLVCLDPVTGKRRWKKGRYGHGQLILVEDLLLIQAESGEVLLVEANPEQHVERARLEALGSKTWNNPALAAPYLLVRNNAEAACYELPLREGA